jgi:hypothetical protein
MAFAIIGLTHFCEYAKRETADFVSLAQFGVELASQEIAAQRRTMGQAKN